MKCINCNIEMNLICDNDCGSISCELCGYEIYLNEKNVYVVGHSKKCGLSDDEDDFTERVVVQDEK